jgi:hypothetical protein
MNQVKYLSNNREYKYQFYFYFDPYLLVLEDELIIDANIEKKDILVVETEDIFFHENLKRLKTGEFTIVFQSFDSNNNFINQMEFHGEKFEIQPNKLIIEFESTFVDNTASSINPYWLVPIENYKRQRVSYIRNSKIESILI